jgi:hypothetical protein
MKAFDGIHIVYVYSTHFWQNHETQFIDKLQPNSMSVGIQTELLVS